MTDRPSTLLSLWARLTVLFLAGLSLTACSLPVPHESVQTTYRLNPIPGIEMAGEGADAKPVLIRLERITAANGFDTSAMVFSRDQQTLSRYRDNRWIAPPAVLIGDAMELSLLHQSWVSGVLRGGQRLPAALDVQCGLDRLEHDVLSAGGRVHLSMTCLLLSEDGDTTLDHWRFDKSQAIGDNDAQHYAAATQRLLDQALKELVQRIYAQVEKKSS